MFTESDFMFKLKQQVDEIYSIMTIRSQQQSSPCHITQKLAFGTKWMSSLFQGWKTQV